MLKTVEKTTIDGATIIDGVEVCRYQARIESDNPKNMSLSNWQVNKELYKANREACRAELAEFEDLAYMKQDEMLTAIAAATEEPTTNEEAPEITSEGEVL